MTTLQIIFTICGVLIGLWLVVWLVRYFRQIDLSGKNVVITGASRGLGLVLARQLVRDGANVAICARDPGELDRASHDLQSQPGRVLAIPCDITDPQAVESFVAAVEDALGSIDVLINNAGIIIVGPHDALTVDDYQAAMQTNFWGPLHMVLAVLPGMRRRNGGRIANIGSIGGKISTPHLLPYSVSKFALTGLSEGLRSEFARDNIVVTTINPGLMRTGSPHNAWFKGKHRAEYAWFSILDSLSLTSISAESAARRIISAIRHGDSEVTLSSLAKFAVLFHGIFPGFTSDILAIVNRYLPDAAEESGHAHRGRDSHSKWSPSWLTTLTEKAARRNNELPSDSQVYRSDR